MAAELSPIEKNLELEELDYDIYRSARELWRPKHARGIFGGAVIAQALSAASRTVPEGFNVHSLHSYFVLKGDETRPVVYHVERARQRNRAIFTMTCSFQKPESSALQHQAAMPRAVMGPEELPSDADIIASGDAGKFVLSPRVRETLLHNVEISPTESRRVPTGSSGKPAHEKRQAFWVRAKGHIQGNGHMHAMALSYFSDSWFLSTSLRVNSLSPAKVSMMASLDHTIYFHKPCKADEWLYFEMESPWSGGGRGFNIGRVFTRSGELVAECIQEGLIRLKPEQGTAKL
ncbi:Putative uncharacterized protein [Taphrina deformans PYCC 5710]|uniref:Acyl-CoA thioesterase II n=1 Tax=Taphrina deformans (strain PYCC 5710 / ATCC 11124 / CBS 356.35 / IMI 108563 / JCM 9778 / NBRC 8474) TaxID=1097556 RepID=R4XK23_TAPDE|nr:Putative uncharacterized protein [Taphrina deformans PYCC 5710]|eukprot:CCG83663.1 Putative uncharacterized protein [Taphrina deformans PYCC 5710]